MIVFDPTLEERLLVEAGAGTGKTWTIAGLYVRLIVEKQYRVNQILVVTFTNAATAELRERLRAKLVAAKHLLESGNADDVFEQKLLNQCADKEKAIKDLTLAIRSFDEAAVYTIHGFCQKLLKETALQSGIGFASELMADDSELIQHIVDDYWRTHTYAASEELLAVLATQKITPESLASDIKSWIGKPWLEVYPENKVSCDDCLNSMQAKKKSAQQLFAKEKENIEALFKNALGVTLNKTSYKPVAFPALFAGLEEYLTHSDVLSLPEKANLFTQQKLVSATTGKHQPIEHPFFEIWEAFCTQHAELKIWLKQQHTKIRVEALNYVRDELKKRKSADSVLGYDDLLLLLSDALNAEGGESLATTILKQFPVALIDEFQDTDPIQYNIFNRIYAADNNPLIFVGDPKQAIYSFRGADIHTYLNAKARVGKPLSLEENFRSSKDFIKAVNTLFSAHKNPFRESNVDYQSVKAGRGEEQQKAAPAALGALRIWNDFTSKNPVAKGTLEPRIVDAVANEIATMLNHASDKKYQLAGRDLRGGDIAVLVRKNKQGQRIKEALNRRNIGCVQQMNDNVFTSTEANDLASVLHALTAGARDNDYRAALATVIFGVSGQAISDFQENAEGWENWLEKLYRWKLQWQEQGFMVMIRTLLIEEDCYTRILQYPNGERRLTNILHLCELIHQEASRGSLAPESLLLWFNRQRQQKTDNEEAHLRLESEDNLVKIVTVHKSKGLQYGIVFCPFLWDDAPDSKPAYIPGKPFSFHDPDQPEKSWLVMNAETDEQLKAYLIEENFSESLRLLYVALTRAEYHCTLVTGHFNLAHKSAQSWLLYGSNIEKRQWSSNSKSLKGLSIEERLTRLQTLVEKSEQTIYLQDLPDAEELIKSAYREQSPSGEIRVFNRQFKAPKRVTSYTGITRGHSAELPDYDLSNHKPDVSIEEPEGVAQIRGREAGICLHWLMEHLDFTQPVDAQQSLIEDGFRRHGFHQVDIPQMMQWLQTILLTKIDSQQSFCLADIKKQQRIDELEFHYPLAQLNQHKLKALLKQHLKLPAMQTAIDQLNIASVGGYLKGFIDLIFCHQDHYYLVDYKSNWLGAEIKDYDDHRLTDEIANSHYYLQYMIYMVALHRYLKVRLKNYQYQKHIGGVYYLFLRGMSEDTGSRYGIYHDLPDQKLIESLSNLFEQGS